MAAAVAAEALRMRLAPACRRICTAAAGAASAAGAAAGKKTTPASAGGAAKNSTRTTVGSAAAGKAPGAAGGGPEKKKKKLVVLLSTAAKGTGLGHHGSAAGKRAYSSGNGNGGVNTKTAPTAAGNGNGSNGVNTKTAPTAAGNGTNGRLEAPRRTRARAIKPNKAEDICGGCRTQLHQVRTDMQSEHQRLWDHHNYLQKEDSLIRDEVGALLTELKRNQMAARASVARTSYTIILSGGAFLFALTSAVGPVIKNSWQADAVAAMEQKLLARTAAAAAAPTPASSPSAVPASSAATTPPSPKSA